MNDTTKEAILLYVIHNVQNFKDKIEPYKKLREQYLTSEDVSFHDEVKSQFVDLVKEVIADDIAKSLAVNPEEVLEFIQEMNVEEFTK